MREMLVTSAFWKAMRMISYCCSVLCTICSQMMISIKQSARQSGLQSTAVLSMPLTAITIPVCIKCFIKEKILGFLKMGMIDENYHARSSPNEIFELYRKPDIDHLMKDYNVTRLHFVGVDMLSYLYSNDLDKLNKREFNEYMKFLSTICEREDLTGFSIHMLDIFRKN